jgi:hypothetical protein
MGLRILGLFELDITVLLTSFCRAAGELCCCLAQILGVSIMCITT